MTDDVDRKQPRGFKPPPWEREQFEELARLRAVAEAEAAAAPASAGAQGIPAEEAPAEAAAQAAPTEAAKPTEDRREEDERIAEAMLLELSGQEGLTLAPLRQAGKVAAVLIGGAGLVVVVLGVSMGVVASGAEAGAGAGTAGAVTIALFGLLSLGMAAWMWMRANRSQGS
jgi:TRAP-type mannitol/chloroaromatic compound transport system permease large subunit